MSRPSKWKYFSQEELSCTGACPNCTTSWERMDELFMEKLVALRELIGEPLPITSAYRCPDRNQKVSKTGANGPHTTGRAVDISASGILAWKIITAIDAELPFSGVGINQRGPWKRRFIHIDDVEDRFKRPRVWTY